MVFFLTDRDQPDKDKDLPKAPRDGVSRSRYRRGAESA